MPGITDRLGRALGSVAGRAARQFSDGFRYAVKGNVSDAHDRTPGGRRQDTGANTRGPYERPEGGPKAMSDDPYEILGMMGYKERQSAVSYETLRTLLYRMPILSVIIHTRVEQIASFSGISRDNHDMGYRVVLRDKNEEQTRASRRMCQQFEQFILRTGVTSNPRKRDDFGTYLRKITRDALTFDQNCTEIVASRSGKPAAFYAVDAANIRIAENFEDDQNSTLGEDTAYVEVYDGAVRAEFSEKEMIFGVRNPNTDIRLSGYGTSELEMALVSVTNLLNGFDFNAKAFSQGTMAKGILNIREENISAAQLNTFERKWNALLRGEDNAWRVPILNAKEGVEWINLQQGSDMAFREWVDFQIKVLCSSFSMAPEEINFRYGGIGQSSVMSEDSNRDKLIESRERGLRPLLRHIAQNLNQYLVWPISEAVELQFVGLDAKSPEEQADFNVKRCRSYMTVNEVRKDSDLKPIDGGDTILDASFMQGRAQGQQAAMPGMGDYGAPDPFGQTPQEPAPQDAAAQQGPQQEPQQEEQATPLGQSYSSPRLQAGKALNKALSFEINL